MKRRDNPGCGITIVLTPGDSLDDVPESHCDIVTDEIREAFEDPVAFFLEVARNTSLPHLSQWLRVVALQGSWSLLIADTYMTQRATVGGFRWSAEDVSSAIIVLGSVRVDQLICHHQFAALYSSIRLVLWDDIGCGGGIYGPDSHFPLDIYGLNSKSKQFPESSSVVFGSTACGDALLHNAKGEAGLLSHETGEAYAIGSISEVLDWVFIEFLAGRWPEFDYNRVK